MKITIEILDNGSTMRFSDPYGNVRGDISVYEKPDAIGRYLIRLFQTIRQEDKEQNPEATNDD